jgi:diacylglycerol kinase (ATP)
MRAAPNTKCASRTHKSKAAGRYVRAMHGRGPGTAGQAAEYKNRPFRQRLGFALAGIRIVWRREHSFRTQCVLGAAALALTALLRPGWAWAAVLVLAIGLVLALEMVNAALEYAIDRLHPEIAPEIGFAKDAAAGAVLAASFAALLVGAAMLLSLA